MNPKGILSEAQWTHMDYKQRMTSAQWKAILLDTDDTLIFNGSVYRLKAKRLGCGVVEIYKAHKLSEERK